MSLCGEPSLSSVYIELRLAARGGYALDRCKGELIRGCNSITENFLCNPVLHGWLMITADESHHPIYKSILLTGSLTIMVLATTPKDERDFSVEGGE